MSQDSQFGFILLADGTIYCTVAKFSSGLIKFDKDVRFGSENSVGDILQKAGFTENEER